MAAVQFMSNCHDKDLELTQKLAEETMSKKCAFLHFPRLTLMHSASAPTLYAY